MNEILPNPHVDVNNARNLPRATDGFNADTEKLRAAIHGMSDPFQFRAFEIQQLAQKIDGETEHLFLAFLNGKAVGSITARIWDDKACGIRRLFVCPKERGRGIATRLLNKAETFARQERSTCLEIAVNRGNVNARQWWIRKKFYDAPSRDAAPDPVKFICMIKPI